MAERCKQMPYSSRTFTELINKLLHIVISLVLALRLAHSTIINPVSSSRQPFSESSDLDQNGHKKKLNFGFTSIRLPETQLQMNTNIALCLLAV